jgi:parallel beta-helix repeat protein
MKTKYLTVGIILLFIVTNVIPSTAQQRLKPSMVPSKNTWSSLNHDDVKDILHNNLELTTYKNRFFPIYILNNNDLKGFRGKLHGVVSGSGTKNDPYIISSWELQSRYLFNRLHRSDGIHFENIDKHVIIKNNYLHGFGYLNDADGIELFNCYNITVENNNITGCHRAVCCWAYPGDSLCLVQKNILCESFVGICVTYSHGMIVNNTIFNNNRGIVCNSAKALVAGNTVFSNSFVGMNLIGEDASLITSNTIYENDHSGIGVGVPNYDFNPTSLIKDNTIFSNGWGISCWIPMNVTIQNNSISSNLKDGIYVSDSTPTIIDNDISANGGCGIYSCGDRGFLIDHNTIANHEIGIYSYLSDSLIITNNNFTLNSLIGIDCQSSHPQVHYNNFRGNGCAVIGDGWMGPVNATWNWWGAANGPSGSGPGDGDPVNDYVDYDPWLISPNPNAG